MEKAREFQESIYFSFTDDAKAFDFVDHNKLWKILKEIGIPDHLTCLLRNLYAGQEVTELEKVSFHSNHKEKAMPQNAQTTAQLHSSHMLVK